MPALCLYGCLQLLSLSEQLFDPLSTDHISHVENSYIGHFLPWFLSVITLSDVKSPSSDQIRQLAGSWCNFFLWPSSACSTYPTLPDIHAPLLLPCLIMSRILVPDSNRHKIPLIFFLLVFISYSLSSKCEMQKVFWRFVRSGLL